MWTMLSATNLLVKGDRNYVNFIYKIKSSTNVYLFDRLDSAHHVIAIMINLQQSQPTNSPNSDKEKPNKCISQKHRELVSQLIF